MSKIKTGLGAAALVGVVAAWLVVSHALSWGMAAALPT